MIMCCDLNGVDPEDYLISFSRMNQFYHPNVLSAEQISQSFFSYKYPCVILNFYSHTLNTIKYSGWYILSPYYQILCLIPVPYLKTHWSVVMTRFLKLTFEDLIEGNLYIILNWLMLKNNKTEITLL